jgi:acetate kinase
MRILVVNVGSTSLKLRVVDDDDRVVGSRELPALGDLAAGALASALVDLGPVDAVGHRIVHGGSAFTVPALVDDRVIAALRALTDLAPLHQPAALDALDAVTRVLPGVPAVACFDTAFHATLPPEASTYAIPQRWRDIGARRYGFHGLSHSWAWRRATEICGAPLPARVVTCHLGGGASLAAVAGGRCIDTTMGFTPLEGLVMATRSGSVDPGLVLWLQQHCHLSTDEVADALEHDSGLVGLCGSADMREVTRRAGRGEPSAVLALGVFIHHLRAGIGAMAAALGGLDALVFTGGTGEGSPLVRATTCAGLGFLGVALDDDANSAARSDQLISPPGEHVRVVVVSAREDLAIAGGVRAVLGGRPATVPVLQGDGA